MSRQRAFNAHLFISLAAAILAGLLVYFVWYPSPYFEASGGLALILVLLGVNLAIGPLITLIVFRPGKRGLLLDMAVIVILQIAAFGYGMFVIMQARPVFLVAVVDRFVMVAANQLEDADLSAGSAPEFRTRSWRGPRLVGAQLPSDVNVFDMAQSAMGGKDVEQLPKYFVPYQQIAPSVLEHSLALATVATSPRDVKAVGVFVSASKAKADAFRWMPLRVRTRDYTLVLDAKTGEPVSVLDIDPWQAR